MAIFSKVEIGLFDCLTGSVHKIEKWPFEIGSDAGVDLRLNGGGVGGRHCVVTRLRGDDARLTCVDGHELWVGGCPEEDAVVPGGSEITFRIGTHMFVLAARKKFDAWTLGLSHLRWMLYDPDQHLIEGPAPLDGIVQLARQRGVAVTRGIVHLQGLQSGFYLSEVADIPHLWAPAPGLSPSNGAAPASGNTQPLPPPPLPPSVSAPPKLDVDKGDLTCPVCWLKFHLADVMHVAVHELAKGDPVLGEDAQQRFFATRFNDRSQALDPFGLPCVDLACPHCRSKLPPGFIHARPHIISLVGNASAGKSYYLSVLAKVMPDVMFQQLGIVWQDADPAGNAGLNDMKSRLFGSLDAEGAALEKTVLGGAMYATVPRFGRKVAMPRPFVFSITPQKRPENQTTCIFYDNAGEHFRPDVSIDDSPGALHVASASGIIFLFDPTRNLEFRRRLRGHDDPQLGLDMNDVQDVILAEMKVRLMKMKNLPPTTKVATPLAVVVGKCDAWLPLLEGKEGRHLVNCVDSKGLDLGHVAMNSAAVRELLLETCPTIVAGAESLSSDVVYFGASAFGHTPVRTSKGTIAPDPNFLNPILVEVPVLWLLSRLGTKLIPTVPAPGRSSRTS